MNREGEGTRRLALGLVLAVSLTVAGGVVLGRWADEGASPDSLGTLGQPGGGTVLAPAPPHGPASTTTPADGPATSTTRPGAASPGPADTPTTAPGATTTTGPPPPGGPPGPACLPSMFDARLTLDRTTYRPGQTVQGTATFTNVSGRTCYWASTAAMVDVVGADGRSVTRAEATIADGLRWAPFEPAEVHTTTATWDQQACPPGSSPGPCAQAGPGQYTLVVTEQPFGVARAGFQLLGT